MTEATVTTVRERIAMAVDAHFGGTVLPHTRNEIAGVVILALGISAERLEALALGIAVIVPVEPTPRMLTAGHAEGVRAKRTDNDEPLWIDMTHATALSLQSRYLPICYRAMLAASPITAAQEGKS